MVNDIVNRTSETATSDKPAEHSPPMAVLPLSSSAKLDQEPNPFEQSFSSANNNTTTTTPSTTASAIATVHNKPVLPPVAAITSPVPSLLRSGVLPKDVANQLAWDSLHAGPLSPSMLQGPAHPTDFGPPHHHHQHHHHHHTSSSLYMTTAAATASDEPSHRSGSTSSMTSPSSSSANTVIDTQQQQQQQQLPSPPGTMSTKKRDRLHSESKDNDDDKRRGFLERNRVAALKCRQRKKQWLNNLQAKVEYLTNDNEQLQIQANALREEIVHLKTLLLAHEDCPVTGTSQEHHLHHHTNVSTATNTNDTSSMTSAFPPVATTNVWRY